MGTIAILPPHLANRIAAGEVVERPASVVKELVENALDAGASRISVSLDDGGRRRITVQDDGRGMSPEDMELAVRRHATSKIRSADDLTGITTLGFRGEALPSIAAVARLEIVSRRAGADRAYRLVVAGGEVQSRGPTGAPEGTQMTVSDLFFNTPGRRKGMRSAATELARITEILQSAALGHPETSFRFSHNGRLLWRTTGAGDLAAAALQVLGPAMARMMLPVDYTTLPPEEEDPESGGEKPATIQVSGLVGLPRAARATRSHQFFIVNGRPVRSTGLREAAEDAYRHLLPMHRYPVWVLHVEVPPEDLDVNVHPSKITVRFADEQTVAAAVREAAAAALRSADIVPRALRRASWARKEGVQTDIGPIPSPRTGTRRRPGRPQPGSRGSPFRAVDDILQPGDEAAAALADGGEPPRHGEPTTDDEGDRTIHGDGAAPETGEQFRRLPPLKVLGVIDRTYIAASGPDGLYLIDQHAAHERIYFENFMKQGRISPRLRQTLAVPLPVDLSPRELAVWEEEQEHVEAFGFVGERFGPGTVLLREVPWIHRSQLTGELHLQELLAGLMQARRRGEAGSRGSAHAGTSGKTLNGGGGAGGNHGSPESPEGGREPPEGGSELRGAADPNLLYADLAMRAMASCKTAVKAQDSLSPEEVEELMALLAETDNPYTCPHGRPTIISVSISRIERWFHRT